MDTVAITEKEGKSMIFLYSSFLWLLLPLSIFIYRVSSTITIRVHIVILLLLVLSLSRPAIEKSVQKTKVEGKDILIAIDVSYSMRATDLMPTRYAFAKKTIESLLENNPKDTIMLIAFTSNPLLLSPPTTDHQLINIALQNLNQQYILTKGTSLKKLFTKLNTLHTEHKQLILMSDGGEENDLSILTDLIKQSHISLITLALGSKKGSTIQTQEQTLLKDKEGNLIITRINPLLESLTDAVHGVYLTASNTPQATASALTKALNTQKHDMQQIEKMQSNYLELYQYPLILALLLFLMVHTRGIKYLILIGVLFGSYAQASLLDMYHLHRAYNFYDTEDFNTSKKELEKISLPSLQSKLTLANTQYKMQHYKKALRLYKSIRSHSVSIKQQLYYNMANTYVHLGIYSKAKSYYIKTLQLGKDDDALTNLKLIALLPDKKNNTLGMAHPKSQGSQSSKSESSQADSKHKRKEDSPSSGSGSGGGSKSKSKQKKHKLIPDKTSQRHPLGSKVYELINKGYIRETKPW